ncbi:HVA22-like protein e isoform X2 [Wolffia australiana]
MGQLWTFLTHLHSIAGPSITLLYPLYASIRAIESPSKVDDEQWLAYWILYSFLTLVEMVAEPVLCWIPIWYQMKVALVAWLVLPQFRGASFIYERFVREQIRRFGGGSGAAISPVAGASPKNKRIEHESEKVGFLPAAEAKEE